MKTVAINRELFADDTIERAMRAYGGLAAMSVTYEQDYALVTFQNCRHDECLTIKEFENYMVGIENS